MTAPPAAPVELLRRERYFLHGEIANGGMASVHIGVLEGALGFSRIVAIKRLHANISSDRRLVGMLIDEARLVSRIRHFNVVPTLDIIEVEGEVFVVMEYVRGAALSKLMNLADEAGELIPLSIVVPIMAGTLRGLGAAHDATDLDGSALGIVHRDVSPQNILVGVGGVPRVIDFGVARAVGRLDETQAGEFKGKLAYAAPEQLVGGAATRRTDIFAAGIVLWELVVGQRLFHRARQSDTLREALAAEVRSPLTLFDSDQRMQLGRTRSEVDAISRIVLKALDRDPANRYDTAESMAKDLEQAMSSAAAPQIGAWVQSLARQQLAAEASIVQRAEAEMHARMGSERRGFLSVPSAAPRPNPRSMAASGEAGTAVTQLLRQERRGVSMPALLAILLAAAIGAAAGSALMAKYAPLHGHGGG